MHRVCHTQTLRQTRQLLTETASQIARRRIQRPHPFAPHSTYYVTQHTKGDLSRARACPSALGCLQHTKSGTSGLQSNTQQPRPVPWPLRYSPSTLQPNPAVTTCMQLHKQPGHKRVFMQHCTLFTPRQLFRDLRNLITTSRVAGPATL
jgi:2'-5' RNA ligase